MWLFYVVIDLVSVPLTHVRRVSILVTLLKLK